MPTNTNQPEYRTIPEVDHVDHQHAPAQKLAPSLSQKPKKRGLIWVVFLLMVAGVAGYAVWRASHPAAVVRGAGGGGGGGGRGGAPTGPVPVVVTKVTRSSIPVYLNGLGNVTAFYTVTVKSRVDGQIMKVDFNEGDLVHQGQVLIEIDPRPYQVQLELAEGTLAHDQALLNNAKLDLERYQTARARRHSETTIGYARLRWWRSMRAISSRIRRISTTPN